MLMSMGYRLRELRLSRQISQEEVARHIGITRSAYSHYEINNRQPVYDTLIKLAAYFDVTLDYIIGGSRQHAQSASPDTKDTQEILHLLQHMNKEQRKMSIDLMTDLIRQKRRTKTNG
jgi:transcriptional regulator with XRE-family HTH domain